MLTLSANQKRVLRQASRIQEKIAKYQTGFCFNNCDFSKEYFANRLLGEEREIFAVAFLDNQHNLIECENMFYGTFDAAAVYPREIAKRMLELNSAAIVLSHNHPSGAHGPSESDKAITKRIVDTVNVIGGRVLDHIIVASKHYSFAENGAI